MLITHVFEAAGEHYCPVFFLHTDAAGSQMAVEVDDRFARGFLGCDSAKPLLDAMRREAGGEVCLGAVLPDAAPRSLVGLEQWLALILVLGDRLPVAPARQAALRDLRGVVFRRWLDGGAPGLGAGRCVAGYAEGGSRPDPAQAMGHAVVSAQPGAAPLPHAIFSLSAARDAAAPLFPVAFGDGEGAEPPAVHPLDRVLPVGACRAFAAASASPSSSMPEASPTSSSPASVLVPAPVLVPSLPQGPLHAPVASFASSSSSSSPQPPPPPPRLVPVSGLVSPRFAKRRAGPAARPAAKKKRRGGGGHNGAAQGQHDTGLRGFLFFVRHHRSRIESVAGSPGMVQRVGEALSEAWESMPADERRPFVEQADVEEQASAPALVINDDDGDEGGGWRPDTAASWAAAVPPTPRLLSPRHVGSSSASSASSKSSVSTF